jgi:hypothetical protein
MIFNNKRRKKKIMKKKISLPTLITWKRSQMKTKIIIKMKKKAMKISNLFLKNS